MKNGAVRSKSFWARSVFPVCVAPEIKIIILYI